MREALHDFIKKELGDSYHSHFGETPFAKHGAPAGTTARLRAWLAKLSELINQRNASPQIVTRTIMFFRPPTDSGKVPANPNADASLRGTAAPPQQQEVTTGGYATGASVAASSGGVEVAIDFQKAAEGAG